MAEVDRGGAGGDRETTHRHVSRFAFLSETGVLWRQTGLLDGVELRAVKGDAGWLSPQPVDCLAIHLSLNGLPSRQHELESHLLELEEALAPFNARAHWGKLAPRTLRAERVAELYGEALGRFKAMAVEHDPDGKFRCGAASSQSSRAAC